MKENVHGFFVLCFLCVLNFGFSQSQTSNPLENHDAELSDKITFELGVSSELSGSGAYYFDQNEFRGGFDTWLTVYAGGDLGKSISYYFDIGVGLFSAEREYLGSWPFNPNNDAKADVYSYPLGYFPYSYRGKWGGNVFPLNALGNSQGGWADTAAIGFSLFGEISGNHFDNILQWRVGRTNREAAGIVEGSSLVLNKATQPFTGYEIFFNPLPELQLYSLTGGLEYFASEGIKTSAATFQNAFSLTMASYHFKNYFQIDIGTAAIWPKRFELGYLVPFTLPMLYQNHIGDFDNVNLFGNLKLQYPGLGFLWFSIFIDEMRPEKDFFHLDREMYAFQAGLYWNIPFLSFSSLVISYTKIEPYCYTHPKIVVPSYSNPMEMGYMNHGSGLGYYLPPNSDEIKAVFNILINPQTSLNVQFQMIRHGADYGSRQVDGSSYLSELEYGSSLTTDPKYRKDFLNDGAYQWLYVIKAGGTYKLRKIPLEFSLNTGAVFSYWQDNGSILNNSEYPSRNGIIADLSVKIFR